MYSKGKIEKKGVGYLCHFYTYIKRKQGRKRFRYAKENYREKRERKKGRSRDIEREGEIREIDRERERKR